MAADRYIDNGKDAFGAVFRIAALAVTAIGFLIFLRHDWRVKFPQDYDIALIGAVLILLISAILMVSSVIADRFGYYLVPLQLMIFARIPFLRNRASDALYFLLPYIGLLLIAGIWTAWSGHFRQCYLPYQSWLFGFPQFSLDGV